MEKRTTSRASFVVKADHKEKGRDNDPVIMYRIGRQLCE